MRFALRNKDGLTTRHKHVCGFGTFFMYIRLWDSGHPNLDLCGLERVGSKFYQLQGCKFLFNKLGPNPRRAWRNKSETYKCAHKLSNSYCLSVIEIWDSKIKLYYEQTILNWSETRFWQLSMSINNEVQSVYNTDIWIRHMSGSRNTQFWYFLSHFYGGTFFEVEFFNEWW